MDQSELIVERLGGPVPLGNAVKQVLAGQSHYGLSHAILASLPTTEIVTTNYDVLLEGASSAADRPVRWCSSDAETSIRAAGS
jgi:hypothetical protein